MTDINPIMSVITFNVNGLNTLIKRQKSSELTKKVVVYKKPNLNIKTQIFIYLFLAALGLCCCVRAFSSCGKRGLLFVAVLTLLIVVPSLVVEHGLQAHGLQELWHTGLAALRHVGSSWTRDRTHVPCIGRQILNHCATREVPRHRYFKNKGMEKTYPPICFVNSPFLMAEK